jgi:hypothetical protein
MVRTYALYMEEKLCTYRATRFEYDKKMSSPELTERYVGCVRAGYLSFCAHFEL